MSAYVISAFFLSEEKSVLCYLFVRPSVRLWSNFLRNHDSCITKNLLIYSAIYMPQSKFDSILITHYGEMVILTRSNGDFNSFYP